MEINEQEEIFKAKLSNSDFNKLSTFITREYGIKMPPAKKVMLQSRLQKRLRELNIKSYKEYIDYVFSKKGIQEELIHMIDVVTTNKTDFFREPSHFEYLKNDGLPEFIANYSSRRLLKAWSAGCSSGEEPYTLAIVFSEFGLNHPGFDFNILATDISSRILNRASMAIYSEDRVEVLPLALKKKYLLKSKDREKKTVRITPQLRQKIIYKRLNLMDASYDVNDMFDIIFCRNVLIYFDRNTQEQIINKLCSKLKTGGLFFLGHSESIMNLNVPLVQIKPTIFKRKAQ